ncbi:ATP-binding protein [Bdellovibrio sp. HCB337]|uniref:ATP-binding protein n=1 Tax=Bdellovibrio sp. HCB337 TaxID=3394358 RepID=UPI0039A6AD9E
MKHDPSRILIDVVETLSMTTTIPMLTSVVAAAARKLTGADGATFVLKEGDKCYYADEAAVSPLWKGKRFPIESCISGWSMIHKEVVTIKDIYQDDRIPHSAYRVTFVKSLCMVPIRAENPIGAIGNYWANGYCPTEEEIKLLQVLANSAAIALENLQLRENILKNNQLPELADHQRQFEAALHTMAHDLKNPISTILLFAELLQTKLHGQLEPRFEGYLKSIQKVGLRVNDQIRRMLDLYTVGNRELEKENVNLSAMVFEVSELLHEHDPSRKVRMEIESSLSVTADPHLIRLAIENLMSNAFKYTSKKDEAKIKFAKTQEDQYQVTFCLQDNGDGFDSAHSENLFRPLVRLHDDSEFPGTGLGLASVARILEVHGGTIRAEGKKHEGASFYFTFPK